MYVYEYVCRSNIRLRRKNRSTCKHSTMLLRCCCCRCGRGFIPIVIEKELGEDLCNNLFLLTQQSPPSESVTFSSWSKTSPCYTNPSHHNTPFRHDGLPNADTPALHSRADSTNYIYLESVLVLRTNGCFFLFVIFS